MAFESIVLFLACASLATAGVVPLLRAEEYDPHPQYSYGYDVQDYLTGDSKSHTEQRDGDVVRGRYTVLDADNTRRIVDYTADPVNGFNAVVRKEPVGVGVAPVAPVAPVAVAPVAPEGLPTVVDARAVPAAAPLGYLAPLSYQSQPLAYQANPLAYQANPLAYQANSVAYQAGPVAYSAYSASPFIGASPYQVFPNQFGYSGYSAVGYSPAEAPFARIARYSY